MSQEKANIHLTNWDIVGINPNDKNWSSGDIFCFWANNIQSLIGFSLIASLYLVYDLNILVVLTSCLLAGVLVAIFSNLIGQPSQKYGLPFPVILRSAFGVSGARYIGMLRGVVGLFMFGVQTFFIAKSIGYLIRIFIFNIDDTILDSELFSRDRFIIGCERSAARTLFTEENNYYGYTTFALTPKRNNPKQI